MCMCLSNIDNFVYCMVAIPSQTYLLILLSHMFYSKFPMPPRSVQCILMVNVVCKYPEDFIGQESACNGTKGHAIR